MMIVFLLYTYLNGSSILPLEKPISMNQTLLLEKDYEKIFNKEDNQ